LPASDPDDECRDADKIVSQLMKLFFYWENKFIRVKLPMMNIGILIETSVHLTEKNARLTL
ncbi:MAG: hypothetical protein IPI77_17600, partial [Saprospiraceae bacterium]|nr:hypothetical protein [Saprospiraceae bacterium]